MTCTSHLIIRSHGLITLHLILSSVHKIGDHNNPLYSCSMNNISHRMRKIGWHTERPIKPWIRKEGGKKGLLKFFPISLRPCFISFFNIYFNFNAHSLTWTQRWVNLGVLSLQNMMPSSSISRVNILCDQRRRPSLTLSATFHIEMSLPFGWMLGASA